MHTRFREYPSDSAKSRYKVPSRVTNISLVTWQTVYKTAQDAPKTTTPTYPAFEALPHCKQPPYPYE
eukprot:1019383-Pleurochrysis_carterae.AAC.1